MQTHESQTKLARLLDQEITRINQQQTNGTTMPQCQELLDKTTDLMNAVNDFSMNKKKYVCSHFSHHRIHHEQKPILLVNYKCYHSAMVTNKNMYI